MISLQIFRGAVLWTKSHWPRNLVASAIAGEDDWNGMIRVMS